MNTTRPYGIHISSTIPRYPEVVEWALRRLSSTDHLGSWTQWQRLDPHSYWTDNTQWFWTLGCQLLGELNASNSRVHLNLAFELDVCVLLSFHWTWTRTGMETQKSELLLAFWLGKFHGDACWMCARTSRKEDGNWKMRTQRFECSLGQPKLVGIFGPWFTCFNKESINESQDWLVSLGFTSFYIQALLTR